MAKPIHDKSRTLLLMPIIRKLGINLDEDELNLEKQSLENKLQHCDKKLDALLKENNTKLLNTNNSFSTLSNQISDARGRIQKSRKILAACKTLLRCKQTELLDLYVDRLKYDRVLSLLKNIDELRNVQNTFDKLVANKQYSKGTELIVSAVKSLTVPLKAIEGLGELRTLLQHKQNNLYNTVLQKLHHQIYVLVPFWAVEQYRVLVSENNSFDSVEASMRFLLFKRDKLALQGVQASGDVTNEQDPLSFIPQLVEALSGLNRVQDAINWFESQINRDLLSVIDVAAKEVTERTSVARVSSPRTRHAPNRPALLPNFFQLTLAMFLSAAATHRLFLDCLASVTRQGGPPFQPYSMDHVWASTQSVIQSLAGNYLSAPVTATRDFSQHQIASTLNVAQFFSQKKQRSSNKPLFKFENSSSGTELSSHSLPSRRSTLSVYSPESLAFSAAKPTTHKLVCPPTPWNLSAVYPALLWFIRDVEERSEESPCLLRCFLRRFVEGSLLTDVHRELWDRVKRHIEGPAAMKCISSSEMKSVSSPHPLLLSAFYVDSSLRAVQRLLVAVGPDFATNLLAMLSTILSNYYNDVATRSYRGIVERTDGHRIVSASWAKDEDISRFICSLPGWMELQRSRTGPQGIAAPIDSLNESPTDTHLAESALLMDRLGTTLVPETDLLTDPTHWQYLANLQESLDWLSNRIRRLISDLSDRVVSQQHLKQFGSLSRQMYDLSETCLLVLHLEIRTHCLHYLMPLALLSHGHAPVTTPEEPDNCVVQLTKEIITLEEILQVALPPIKHSYVMEGVVELITSLLYRTVPYIARINSAGVKQMCRNVATLQQALSLTAAAGRVAQLDRCKKYFELLYLDSGVIVDKLVEEGIQFTRDEYVHIIKLRQRSSEKLPNVIDDELKRLYKIPQFK